MLYSFAKSLFKVILVLVGRYKITGQENLPKDGPVIVVCNHVSYWDPIILGCALDRQVHFMAKAELFSIPIFGSIVKRLGAFPIKRGHSDHKALRMAVRLLQGGKVLGVFPEGTRSKKGSLLPFRTGITMIAYKVGCPVVPVGLINSKGVLLGWCRPVEVKIGKPMGFPQVEKRPSPEELEEWTEQSRQAVALLLGA